jgi:integrase
MDMASKRANGEGSIRHNVERNRWEGRISVNGSRRMVTARTRRELTDRMHTAERAAEQGAQSARADLTVSRYLTRWMTDILPGTVAAATEAQYRDVLRLYVLPRIGTKRLATLSPSDVDGMLRDMARSTETRPEGYSPTARRLARSVLRRALRRAEAEGLIARNAAALSNSVRQDRTEGRSLSPTQARQLLAAAGGHHLEAGIVVALTCGLRLSELLGLAWDAVELDGPTPRLSVRRSLKRVPTIGLVLSDTKTNRSRRVVHLTPAATDALRAHRTRQHAERLRAGERWLKKPLGTDLVFRGSLGRPVEPATFSRAVSDVSEEAGLGHWTPHELRHSAASLLLASAVPLIQVADFLGHSSATVTAAVYAHVLDDARTSTASAMADVLAP